MSSIIASQKLEILVNELGSALYAGFSRKIVVVPSDEVKAAIYEQLAKERDVAFGAKFCKPAQAIHFLLRLLGLHPLFPTPNGLAFHLESELPYIPELKGLLTTPKRLRDFADHLSQIFLRYSKAKDVELSSWQKSLYQKVFSLWNSQAEYLANVDVSQLDVEVHVFGVVPEIYRDFFARLPKIRFYFLNPTQEFWGDLLSEKDRLRLTRFYEKKGVAKEEIAHFSELTEAHHPLLANFGRLGGELFCAYQDLDLPYIEKFSPIENKSLLTQVQNDLLLMECSEYSKDDSIQLHSACSFLREVEVLKTILLNLFAKEENLQPSDVLVLTPNIAEYESHIELTFGSSDLPIPFEIHDLPFSRRSDPAQALLYLFSLQNCAWEREEILRFFHFSTVQEHLCFTDEDLETIEGWLQSVHLKWGFEEAHSVGTWEEAFRRLLLGLAMEEESEHLAHPIELSEADLLGKFLQAARLLREDLKVMESEVRTLSEWSNFLHEVCERYFGRADFLEEISQLGDLLSEARYPFPSIARAIKRTLARSGDRVRGSNQNCVIFSSLKLGNARPAKVIALLGMEKFPHQESFSSLQQGGNLGPSACDEDRHLFLEILLSAREKLLFFYSNLCPQDGREQSVSFLIQELLDYLKLDLHTSHPPFPFHPSYFSQEEGVWDFSPLNFSKAQQKLERPSFFQGVATERSEVIAIEQLRKLAKNPLRFYLNETLNIYLPFEYDEEFLLAPWEKNAMQQQALRGELEIERVAREGKLPSGLFEKVATLRLERDTAPLQECFARLGIENLFDVELLSSCEAPYKLNEKKWILPPLSFEGREIVGKIQNISTEGLLHFASSKLHELLPIWPIFLVYREIAETIGCKKDLLLLKEEKRLQVEGEHLLSFLDYFEEAKEKPSPFFPRAAENILKGRPVTTSTQFLEAHLKWAQDRAHVVDREWEEKIKNRFTYLHDKQFLLYSPLIC